MSSYSQPISPAFRYDHLFSEKEKERLKDLKKLREQIIKKIALSDFHFKLCSGSFSFLEEFINQKCFVTNAENEIKQYLDSIQELALKISFLRKKSIGDPLEIRDFQNSLNVFFGLHFFYAIKEIQKSKNLKEQTEYHKHIHIAFQHFYNYSIVYALLRQGDAESEPEFKNKRHYNCLSVQKKDEEYAKSANKKLNPAQPCLRETRQFYEVHFCPHSWRIARNKLCTIFQEFSLHKNSLYAFQKQLNQHNALWKKKWTLETLCQPDVSSNDTPFPDGIEGIQIDTSQ